MFDEQKLITVDGVHYEQPTVGSVLVADLGH
jgi:hypothetical protein